MGAIETVKGLNPPLQPSSGSIHSVFACVRASIIVSIFLDDCEDIPDETVFSLLRD